MKKCFVITPIGPEDSQIRREIDGVIEAVLRPVLKSEYKIKVAHNFTTSTTITKEIIKEIYDADLIVANLTEANPNVMYELALAHSLRKPVIHIVREGEGVPFDISNHRYIEYENTMKGTVEFKKKLETFVANEDNFDLDKIRNPIIDAIDDIKVEPRTHLVGDSDMLLDIKSNIEHLSRKMTTMQLELNRNRSNRTSKHPSLNNTLSYNLHNNKIEKMIIREYVIRQENNSISSEEEFIGFIKEMSKSTGMPRPYIEGILLEYANE